MMQSPSSQTTDTYWRPFAEKHLPNTLGLFAEGNHSPFFQVVKHTFSLLHDLQFHHLPSKYRAFGIHHFINTQKGALSSYEWLDRLDAKVKEKDEKLPDGKSHLKECCDYDVVRIIYEPLGEEQICDSTGMRKNGAVTPAFCSNVLNHLCEFSALLEKKLGLSSEKSLIQTLFQSNQISGEEKILYFKNRFYDVLSNLYFLEGDSAKLLKLLDIPFSYRLLNQNASQQEDLLPAINAMEEAFSKLVENGVSAVSEKEDLKNLIRDKISAYRDLLNLLSEHFEHLGIILKYFPINAHERKRNAAVDFVLSPPKQEFFPFEASSITVVCQLQKKKQTKLVIKSATHLNELSEAKFKQTSTCYFRIHQIFQKAAAIISRELKEGSQTVSV